MEHKTLSNSQVDLSEFKYKYQDTLTKQLDKLSGDFDQSIINQIVLWKVNRYAKLDKKTMILLNSIDKTDKKINVLFTRQLLTRLLQIKGIRLPMASTILRFKNSNIYQIIDQRAYRIINDQELKLPHNTDEQINLYLLYLSKLHQICKDKGISFSLTDRLLYLADKRINNDKKIKY